MKTSAVKLEYCVLFPPSPLFPRQGVGACNLYHTPTAHPGICRLFNVGPIVLHPAHHCNASHSCFSVLLQSDLLLLPVFVPPCMAEPLGLWGREGTLRRGWGSLGGRILCVHRLLLLNVPQCK